MLDFKANPNRSENEDRIKDPTKTPCVICGKGVQKPWKHTVRIFYGFTLVTEEEAKELDSGGDMGAWPIGADCLRLHPEFIPYLIGET